MLFPINSLAASLLFSVHPTRFLSPFFHSLPSLPASVLMFTLTLSASFLPFTPVLPFTLTLSAFFLPFTPSLPDTVFQFTLTLSASFLPFTPSLSDTVLPFTLTLSAFFLPFTPLLPDTVLPFSLSLSASPDLPFTVSKASLFSSIHTFISCLLSSIHPPPFFCSLSYFLLPFFH
jgi:hypothetical protein